MRKAIVYQILLWLVLFLMLLPLMQTFFPVVEEPPLKGSYWWAKDTAFSWKGWWDGGWQENKEKWIKENFGFRNTCVRFRNQMGWWMYGVAYTNGVLKGGENVLLDKTHIDAYTGDDLLDRELVKKRVGELKKLEAYLKERGKKMILVIAPGKASFFPEQIPSEFKKTPGMTNRRLYNEELGSAGIPCIDFMAWFRQIKDTSRYALYPKGGIHWSEYGALLAFDSLLSFITPFYPDSFPDLHINQVQVREELAPNDKDIAESMNLLFPLKLDPMPYGFYSAAGKNTGKKMLVVADSYFWTMPYWVLKDRCFTEVNFLYYNRELNPIGQVGVIIQDPGINRIKLVEEADLILFLVTEANLRDFPWKFPEQVLKK